MRPLNLNEIPVKGIQMVEASAGTGKTYTITNLVLKLLLDPVEPLELPKILLVSFTKASTQELVDRIAKRLQFALSAMGQPGFSDESDPYLTQLVSSAWQEGVESLRIKQLKLAVQSLDESQIYTLHSFCSRVLTQYAFDSGQSFSDELLLDSRPIVKQAVADFWGQKTYLMDQFHLGLLAAEHIDPTFLLKLYTTANQQARLNVLVPAEPRPMSLSRFDQLKAQAKQLWEPTRLLGLFEKATGLNRNKIRQASLLKGAEAIQAWFEKPTTNHQLPEHFALFSEQKIIGSKKATGSIPEDPFFLIAGQLVDESTGLSEYGALWCAAFLGQFLESIKQRIEDVKDSSQVRFFEDLLVRLEEAIDSGQGELLVEEVKKNYQVALIDEFQDTDGLQYKIFHRFFGSPSHGLFLIGDPKQAIYSFRGGDIFTYAKARQAADDIWGLDTNWRTDQRLVNSVNHLFGRSASRAFYFDFIEFSAVQGVHGPRMSDTHGECKPLVVHWCPKTDQPDHNRSTERIQADWANRNIPKLVAQDIVELLGSNTLIHEGAAPRAVGPQDIAVLVRKNEQAVQIQKALRLYGVPAVFQASSELFKTPIATQLYRFLSSLINPHRHKGVRLALSGDFFGLSTAQMAILVSQGDELADWLARFNQWSELWVNRGFSTMINLWMEQVPLGENLLKQPGGEQAWANLREMLQVLQKEASLNHFKPHQLVCFLEEQIKQTDSTAYFEPKASDQPAVTLVTIHKSKGLEYPICFFPYLWTSKVPKTRKGNSPQIFHLPGAENQVCMDLEPEQDHQWEFQTEGLAEDLRLLYVALTRAKHQNHLYFGPIGEWEYSAFWYLISSPEAQPNYLEDLVSQRLPYLQLKESFGKYSAQGLEEELNNFFEPIRPLVSWETAEFKGLSRHTENPRPEPTLTPWLLERTLQSHFRVGSYSGLIRKASSHPTVSQLAKSSTKTFMVLLAKFPKGAHVGLFFHQLLENLNFDRLEPEYLTTQVTTFLDQYRIDVDLWAELVSKWLLSCLQQPLLGSGVSLSCIDRTKRLIEMEFYLSFAGDSCLTAENLPSVFLQGQFKGYREALQELDFEQLEGFLTGFIDLFFESQGKYYVLDYKSNHLGESATDYNTKALSEQMEGHHYYLQAWLYSLAVHRFLALKIENYDYETHFGGCVYLFLRGVGTETGGVSFCRPTAEEIRRLDQLFGAL